MSTADAPNMPDELPPDVVEGLRWSLSRASLEDLGAGSAAVNWRKMQDWLVVASTVHAGQTIPPLPITGQQLRALQSAVDDVVRRRLSEREPEEMSRAERAYREAMAVPPANLYERLYRNLSHITASSWIVGGLLAALVIADLLALVVLRTESRAVMVALATNLGLALLASVAWAYHHNRVSHHTRHVQSHFPHH